MRQGQGGEPHFRTECAPWGTLTVGRTEGTSLPYETRSLGYPPIGMRGALPIRDGCGGDRMPRYP
ncbi:MAG: hypothetical protein H6Q83_301 [Deltaproteobacteria bacterium]|nr:hypothetical protein [Deltaproteobacteria bacterium]MBP2688114.1 hypothetical protein [Deltaproteobacteria bacterium]